MLRGTTLLFALAALVILSRQPPAVPMPPAALTRPVTVQAESSPVTLSGAFGHNVSVALEANSRALMDVRIVPGATWSFNAAMGDPAQIAYVVYAGEPGGGWCDLAARYIQVARQLGASVTFQHHGLQLAGVDWEDSVAIWNIGGQPGFDGGRQDLLIANTTPHLLRLWAQQDGDSMVIVGVQL